MCYVPCINRASLQPASMKSIMRAPTKFPFRPRVDRGAPFAPRSRAGVRSFVWSRHPFRPRVDRGGPIRSREGGGGLRSFVCQSTPLGRAWTEGAPLTLRSRERAFAHSSGQRTPLGRAWTEGAPFAPERGPSRIRLLKAPL